MPHLKMKRMYSELAAFQGKHTPVYRSSIRNIKMTPFGFIEPSFSLLKYTGIFSVSPSLENGMGQVSKILT